jgi:hypothetical protein
MRQACGTQANLAPLLLGFPSSNSYPLITSYILPDILLPINPYSYSVISVTCYGQAWRPAPSLQRQAIDA